MGGGGGGADISVRQDFGTNHWDLYIFDICGCVCDFNDMYQFPFLTLRRNNTNVVYYFGRHNYESESRYSQTANKVEICNKLFKFFEN